MYPMKESPPKLYDVEFESCYRGKIEIWRSVETGKVIRMRIIR